MQPLNPIEALSPAFTRTHDLLFRPFRLGRSWKLAASQYVGLIGAAFVPLPLVLFALPLPLPGAARGPLAIVALISTLILFGLFSLGVRMQFVNFEMVVTRQQIIAPMWRRSGARVWPWVWLKTLLGTALFAAFLPLFYQHGKALAAALPDLAESLQSTFPRPPGNPAAMQAAVIAFYSHVFQIILPLCSALFLFAILLKLITTTLEDFALPFYILDSLTLPESIRSGAQVLAADPLQTIFYLVLKFVLSVIGFLLQIIASQVAAVPVAVAVVVLAVSGALIGAALGIGKSAHGFAFVLFILAAVLLYAASIAVTLWVQIFTLGYLSTLLEAYAIYFLGGRYQRLGQYLDPPDYTFAPPPLPPSQEERDNDNNDPPYPLNPALA